MSSAVSPRQNALCATSRDASSMSDTMYALRNCPLCGTRGPCITSPYQIEPANSALKLRRSSGSLDEPLHRDRPCCCSSRCTAERDRLLAGTVPAASSRRTMWRTERRGFARLAARIASCSAGAILDAPRSARGFGASPSMPRLRQA